MQKKILHQINRLRNGYKPADWKPFSEVDRGLMKMRFIQDGVRVPYFEHDGKIRILSLFKKKKRTKKSDIKRAEKEFAELKRRSG